MTTPAAGDKRTLVIPIVIITVGVGWLLTTLGVLLLVARSRARMAKRTLR